MKRIAIAVAGLGLVVAACGGAASAPTTTSEPVPATTVPASTAAPVTTTVPTTEAVTTTPVPTTTVPPTSTTTVPPTTTTLTAAQSALFEALSSNADVSSGRMEGSFVISGMEGLPAGTDITLGFSGEFDNEAGVFAWSMDMSAFADLMGDQEIPPEFADMFGGDVADLFSEMEIRQIDRTAYLRFPLMSTLLGADTDWISFPADESGVTGNFAPVTPINPGELSDLFTLSPDVTEIGADTVRGVDAVHYYLTFDMDRVRELADEDQLAQLGDLGSIAGGELPLDVWISKDGLILRYEMSLAVTGSEVPGAGDSGRVTMRFDIFDHGAVIDVEAPPAEEVTDVSYLMGIFTT